MLARGEVISTFKATLTDERSREAANSGIRMHGGVLKSYKQRKDAFAYFYVKREVGTAGIYTKPLTLTLVPFPQAGVALQTYAELCIDFKCMFIYANTRFVSIRQAVVYYKVVDAPLSAAKKAAWIEQIWMSQSDVELKKIYAECVTYQGWENTKYHRLKDIVRVRVGQVPLARESLLSTASCLLFNAERKDNEWGVGETWNVVRWLKTSEIRGRNYLGIAYQEIREELQ